MLRSLLALAGFLVPALMVGVAEAQSLGGPGSFPLHEEHGSATLIERTGVGTEQARMVGEFTPGDIEEMCKRVGWKFYSPSFPFHKTQQDRNIVGICREKEEAKPVEQRRYVVTANCNDGVLRNPLGYVLRRDAGTWQTESGRPVTSEFSPAYAQIVSRQYEMLCSARPRTVDLPPALSSWQARP
jgi:hypothetical protein